jgi:hypothetical protein
LWTRNYNGPSNGNDFASSIALDGGGNIYVTGKSTGSGTNYDYATIKYDPNGNQKWAARYNGSGNNKDEAYALAADNLGNVYVTGRSTGSGTDYDYATIKYDPNGNQLWAARYNGDGNGADYAYAIALDATDNVYVTGYSYGNGTSYDYLTIKYDPNGNKLWEKRSNCPQNKADCATELALDNGGNVYVAGYAEYGSSTTGYDYVTIKYTQHNYCTGTIETDLNDDCKVDFADFALFAEDWLGENNWLDLAILADKWLNCNFALQEDCL